MSLTAGKQLLLSSPAGGYQVSRSLRFNASDSAFCSRVVSSAGNRKTWTWSAWVKRTKSSSGATYQSIFTAGIDGNNNSGILFDNSDRLEIWNVVGNVNVTQKITSQVFRDFSGWYHFVVSATSSTLSLYVNGVEVTAWATNNQPGNEDWSFNAATTHYLARYWDGSSSFPGDFYLAEIHFIDGQALTPSSFAETDATTGQWIPKLYSGSYGTNGFKLNFADNSAATATTLGKDTSGNSNNWTPNNFSVLDGRTSVAAATGALPIYNTTDTYGAALGSGVRSDSFASSLVLAAPLTTQGGGSLTNDVSPSGRTSSTKTLTNTNVTSSTSVSKYYGGSAVFSSSSSSAIDIAASSDFQFGSGDFTVEFWIYPTNTTGQNVLGYGNSSGGTGFALIKTASQFQGQFAMSDGTKVFTGGSYTVNTWNHVAAVRSGSTITLYVNGTSSATASTSGSVTTGTDGFAIGRYGLYGGSCDAQFQDVRVYKGVAKYTSNFTPPTSVQNVTTAAGCDSTVDTPSSYGTDDGLGGSVRGNYATLNPLNKNTNAASPTNGNLDYPYSSGAAAWLSIAATIGVTSGKYYWEITPTAVAGNGVIVGIANQNYNFAVAGSSTVYLGHTSNSWGYYSNDGKVYTNSAGTSYGNTFTANDVIGVALDMDNGKCWFSKNGTWQNSGSPTGGTNAAVTGLTGSTIFPAVSLGDASPNTALTANFGQRSWAYQAPAGFKALCDTNLPSPVIAKPSTVMDVKLYTGNGSTQTVSGLGFSPDLVWLKSRSSGSYSHNIYDAVRGATKIIYSDSTSAENTDANGLTAFNSDGFSLGSTAATNASSTTYVGWIWDAGSSAAAPNNSGSITSTVKVNASSGFSIVTFTSNASGNATVGHGLGVAPSLVILKNRTGGAGNWLVFHKAVCTKDNFLYLNSTNALGTYTDVQGAAIPSSTVFGINAGIGIAGSADCVAYCFAPVTNYSSFGSYVGNGSADGVFVHLGFRPKWLMVKRTDAAEYWIVFDAVRNTYNIVDLRLLPSASNAEGSLSTNPVDFLSNGFKNRGSDTFLNGSGATYIYAAFAESPFQYARAR